MIAEFIHVVGDLICLKNKPCIVMAISYANGFTPKERRFQLSVLFNHGRLTTYTEVSDLALELYFRKL